MSLEELLHKIIEKEATIAQVGLGYTGLGLAHEFGMEGFQIIGFDIDRSKIEMLRKGQNYLPFLPLPHLTSLLEEKRFIPTDDPRELAKADVKIISVPTPLNAQREPDITFLEKACRTVGSSLKKDQLIIVQSTSYPGTTEEIALPIFEKESGLKVGVDFFLAHVPEREDAGNPLAVLSKVPRVCGGITRKCLLLAKTLYEHITVKVHPCSSATVAEAVKTYENTFRLINIAYVDEMKIAFDKMGINIWEVIEGASTKPFGFTPFYPGPGIGGECIPVDSIYLAKRAKLFNGPTTLIETASKINIKTSDYVVQKISDILLLTQKNLNGASILLLGVAFKKDLSDTRESPSLRILKSLQEAGAQVAYHDFFVPKLEAFHLDSICLSEKALKEFDCVAILTDHSQYDWKFICESSKLILDTRNATKGIDPRLKKKIFL